VRQREMPLDDAFWTIIQNSSVSSHWTSNPHSARQTTSGTTDVASSMYRVESLGAIIDAICRSYREDEVLTARYLR
jgi:hypothetical protein